MEEAFATRKLIKPAELKALNTKSDLRGGLQMASHLGLIAGLAALHFLALGKLVDTGYRVCAWCCDQFSLCRAA